MKKIIMFFSIFLMILLGIVYYYIIYNGSPPLQVEIISPDERIVWPLHADNSLNVKTKTGALEIKIEKGFVFVKASSCRDKTCIKAGKIHQQGQSILCAPSRIFIRIIPNSVSSESGLMTY